jgi:hypothetical protein
LEIIEGLPTILENFAWGSEKRGVTTWDDMKIPLSYFCSTDYGWIKKFHVWRMEGDYVLLMQENDTLPLISIWIRNKLIRIPVNDPDKYLILFS